MTGDYYDYLINEGASTRYSIEVNYRSHIDQILNSYAKIVLGYASAALKRDRLHVKQVFDDPVPRILVSSSDWNDGTWTIVSNWNKDLKSFIISRGFYRKDLKQVSKQGESRKSNASSSSELVSDIKEEMGKVKELPDRHIDPLKKVKLKTGPKR